MQIANDKVVTLNYTLTDDSGKVIDQSSDGSFAYLHGAQNIIPGLEKALEGKTSGDKATVAVSPDEGYGERSDALTHTVGRDMFGTDDPIEVGMQFQASSPDGQMLVVTVTDIDGDQVTIDGNHPLAGVNLNFDVEVIDVRDASAEELDHGHVHGPDGHGH